MRSAFMLSTMYLKPLPSSPIRFSAGTSRLSKNTSQVLWLIMASILRISTPLPYRLAQVDQEHRQPVRALPHLVGRRGARQQQHQVGMQHAAGPHLLAVDDVAVVALLVGARLELRGVGAGGRLGDAERLQAQRAGGDPRQVLLLLRLAAVPQHGAHGVHLRVAGRRVAALLVDRLEDGAGGRQRQPGAVVLLRDQRAEIAGLRQRGDELGRIGVLVVELQPVLVGKPLADALHALADLVPAGIEGDGDGVAALGHWLGVRHGRHRSAGHLSEFFGLIVNQPRA